MSNYNHTVLLAGTARSGTTWVQDIINCDGSYRVLFEPFHSYEIKSIANWNHKQYLRKDNTDGKYLNPAREIFDGNIRHNWTDQFNKNFDANNLLIKDIRVNLLLNWINQNFPNIPIVLLLRHPCAVANSKIKLGWKPHLRDYLVQEDLMDDFLNLFKSELENTHDDFEKHILMWCIENYVPLRQFKAGDILVVFYEKLCEDPKNEIKRIFSFIGDDYPNKAISVVRIPSALSREDSAIITGSNLLDTWRENIDDTQILRAMEILRVFGMDKIYRDESFPVSSNNNVFINI